MPSDPGARHFQRRTFLVRSGMLAGGAATGAVLPLLPRNRVIASATDFADCDMMTSRDTRPHKGFASSREGSGGQCTTHAARRFDAVAPYPGVNWSGGARLWYTRAADAGWVVTDAIGAARIGAIAVWDNWDGVSAQRLFNGHVAFVEELTEDGLVVSEMNWGSLCVGERRWRTSMWGRVAFTSLDWDALEQRGTHRFVGYIYPQREPDADWPTDN